MNRLRKLRHVLLTAIAIVACAAAVAGVSIWFLPKTGQALWDRHTEYSISSDGTRSPVSQEDARALFLTPSDRIRIHCSIDQGSLTGTLLIIHSTSLEYGCVPGEWDSYRHDHGIGPTDLPVVSISGPSIGPTDYDRRFPHAADEWFFKPRLAHSFVRTAEPHRNGWDFELLAPYWIVTTVLVAPAALLLIASSSLLILRRTNRARRRNKGLCESCGYDLRASQDRCPECNHPIPTPKNPPPTPSPAEADSSPGENNQDATRS